MAGQNHGRKIYAVRENFGAVVLVRAGCVSVHQINLPEVAYQTQQVISASGRN